MSGHATKQEARAEPEPGEFSLWIPPKPKSIRTARLFGAAVARLFGSDEGMVEDLKIALSEACSAAIRAHSSGERSDPVRIVVRPGENELTFEVADSAGFEPVKQAPAELSIQQGSFGLALIRALFEDATFRRNDSGGTTVSFSAGLTR